MKIDNNTIKIDQEEWLEEIACALDHLPLGCSLEEAIEDAIWSIKQHFGSHVCLDIPSVEKDRAEQFYFWLEEADVVFCGNEL